MPKRKDTVQEDHDPVTGEVTEGPRSFGVFLSKIDDGAAERELSRQLHALVLEMRDEAHARNAKVKGALALTVALVVPPKGVAEVAYAVASKHPKKLTGSSHFWLTAGGNLTEHNPRQASLPLREVDGPPDARELDTPDERAAKEVADEQRGVGREAF